MLSTMLASDPFGKISRIFASMRSHSTPVSSIRVPIGARTCILISLLSASGKKLRPRKGARQSDSATAAMKPATKRRGAASASANNRA